MAKGGLTNQDAQSRLRKRWESYMGRAKITKGAFSGRWRGEGTKRGRSEKRKIALGEDGSSMPLLEVYRQTVT